MLSRDLIERTWNFYGVGHATNDVATRGLDPVVINKGWDALFRAFEPWYRQGVGKMWLHSVGGLHFVPGEFFQWQQTTKAIEAGLYSRNDLINSLKRWRNRLQIGCYIGCMRGNPEMEELEKTPHHWWQKAWEAVEPLLLGRPHVIGCDATTVYPPGSLPWCMLQAVKAAANSWGGIVIGENAAAVRTDLQQRLDGAFSQFGATPGDGYDGVWGLPAPEQRNPGKVFAQAIRNETVLDQLRLCVKRKYVPVAELYMMLPA